MKEHVTWSLRALVPLYYPPETVSSDITKRLLRHQLFWIPVCTHLSVTTPDTCFRHRMYHIQQSTISPTFHIYYIWLTWKHALRMICLHKLKMLPCANHLILLMDGEACVSLLFNFHVSLISVCMCVEKEIHLSLPGVDHLQSGAQVCHLIWKVISNLMNDRGLLSCNCFYVAVLSNPITSRHTQSQGIGPRHIDL